MFLDVLEMIFVNFEGVINALDVTLFSIGSLSVTFWQLLLGFLTVSLLFGFFLTPRSGSVLDAAGVFKDERAARDARLHREADSAHRNSYAYYKEQRDLKEGFSNRYNSEKRGL